MSWYKESVSDLIKKAAFDLESSKMPCIKFSKQKQNENSYNCQKKTQELQHLDVEEEAPDELV